MFVLFLNPNEVYMKILLTIYIYVYLLYTYNVYSKKDFQVDYLRFMVVLISERLD